MAFAKHLTCEQKQGQKESPKNPQSIYVRLKVLIIKFCFNESTAILLKSKKTPDFFNFLDMFRGYIRSAWCIISPVQAVMLNCYVGETSQHFSSRVHENLSPDRSSHVFKHSQNADSWLCPPFNIGFGSFSLCDY